LTEDIDGVEDRWEWDVGSGEEEQSSHILDKFIEIGSLSIIEDNCDNCKKCGLKQFRAYT
jgi:isocitrate lyase